MTPYKILLAAAETNKAKSAEYGDNYLKFGSVMAAIFPEGVAPASVQDHNRFHLFVQMTVKLTRYAENWGRGGHADSLMDLSVYAAMLRSLDEEINNVPSI